MDKLERRERFAKKYSSAAGGPKKELNVMGRRGPGETLPLPQGG